METIALDPESLSRRTVRYSYSSERYYDLVIENDSDRWTVDLLLKEFPALFVKEESYNLLDPFKEHPIAYGAFDGCKELGLILFEREWNNSLRIWDILVWEECRRMGVGRKLMDAARDYAITSGMRRLVLETQSCNYPAISFYLKYGFELAGFDTACYSNEDIERREVRLEFHYLL